MHESEPLSSEARKRDALECDKTACVHGKGWILEAAIERTLRNMKLGLGRTRIRAWGSALRCLCPLRYPIHAMTGAHGR